MPTSKTTESQKTNYEQYWADGENNARRLMGGTQTRYDRRLMSKLLPRSSRRLLEIGCGIGSNLQYIDEKDGTTVVGVDLSANGAKAAKKHYEKIRKDVFFIVADAKDLPFKDETFDCTFFRDLLHHVDDREETLKEATRVTTRGGTAAAAECNILNPPLFLIATLLPVERGLFKNTAKRLLREFSTSGVSVVSWEVMEFFPRHILLSPRFPLNTLFQEMPEPAARAIMTVEKLLERIPIVRLFGNYIVIVGRKT